MKIPKILIVIISVAVPLIVTVLYLTPKLNTTCAFFSVLPLVNAIINGSTFIVLLIAVRAIKNKNITLHKKWMFVALGLSVLFLISYVVYHFTTPSTKFGGQGILKYVYYFILLTHILLSVIIIPMVLVTLTSALNDNVILHRKIAKITLPIWLYVTFSGVLVYLLISPYYIH